MSLALWPVPAVPRRSRPLHLGRQRHQDGFRVAAGLEAELGAAVVQEVELHVTPAVNFALGSESVEVGRAAKNKDFGTKHVG